MCGRYTLKTPISELQAQFGLLTAPEALPARYNIAPSQDVAIVSNESPTALTWARWGLIPSWAKDAHIGYKMINARGETLAEKPSYRRLVKARRCLVLTDGFYEWMPGEREKTPMYIHLKGEKAFAFGGLWDSWTSPEGKAVKSVTIITTSANAFVAPVHDRMPLILNPTDYARWLSPTEQNVADLIVPYQKDNLEAWAVSRRVNSPKNDVPDCVAPV